MVFSNGVEHYGFNKRFQRNNLVLVIMFCGFQKEISHTYGILLGTFRTRFGPYKVQYVLPNNIVLLVTIEKFETNHVLINVNKLKPHKYMESKV
jgi:hypothetical protein